MSDPQTPANELRGTLRRADKIMDPGEVSAFLGQSFCGRTATIGPDGYPYVVPNLFVWLDGQVYLHTSRVPGHFLQNAQYCARVSFEVDEPGEVFPYGPVECDTSVSYRSVVLFGRIRLIDESAEKTRFYSAFMRKYAPEDSWGRERDSFPRLDKTIVYAIRPESITGKQGPLPGIDKRWRPAKPVTSSAS